jgi:spore coat polysaccharide biosynthesis protein SpsF (cytidylyltransferase family)/aryl-alcohol dehydrogenase-like predicted oxidoreductase
LDSIVVLQARTSSTRLPAKVLLPVNGLPLVVLAAKRAANTGRNVIIVTSTEPSDDGLVKILQSYDLKYFRGSLENTLERIVAALAEYDDNTIVFRLTADNIFPDGLLLDEIEGEFLIKGYEYLLCNGEPSGLPYGMSVEVTRLYHLRDANSMNLDIYDREHVTPYIKRKYGVIYFNKYKYLNKGHYRCTIDCLDDYLSIQNVFNDVIDPVNASSLELVECLEGKNHQPIATMPIPKLVFGTAQLGGDYGIANKTGKPDLSHCRDMIKTAIANGVIYLDTARAYGNSEAMIGSSLGCGWEERVKIITKLSPLQDCTQGISDAPINVFVDASIYKSCNLLRRQKIDVLMLHRVSHISQWNGKVWNRLLELKSEGKIGELGVSVQNPEELSKVLQNTEIQYIQLPFNLLDWRWDSIIVKILEIRKNRKLTIHVRSSLLQGLLPSDENNHWLRANVDEPKFIQNWLSSQVNICKRNNIVDLCIGYVNSLKWVDGIAIGMENMSQLIENISYFISSPLSKSQIKHIQKSRPILTEASLNPTLWKN